MIVTVTPNPAIDKTVVIHGFRAGAMNRASVERVEIGGKGINVARNLVGLGCRVTATGFVDAHDARGIVATLAADGVQSDFIPVADGIRVNLKILDPTNGVETEINESGRTVSAAAIHALGEKLTVLARRCAVIVFSGSLPPGTPDDFYARYIHLARRCGVTTILDTAGAALRHGIEAKPDLVKPNRVEAEELLEMQIGDDAELIDAGRQLLDRGPRAAVISLGAAGAFSVSADGMWRSRAPEIAARGTVGAGDAMVAALASALAQRLTAPEALRFATAFGTAAAASATRVPSAENVEPLLSQVSIELLSPAAMPNGRESAL